MVDPDEEPMATLGELAARNHALVGRQPVSFENRIGRTTLKQRAAGYFQAQAATLGRALSRRAEEKPVAAIFIGLGVGLIAGELLKRAVSPRRR
jgi:hypothetical protein